MTKPNKTAAGQAADLLGLDVFDLMHMLRSAAVREIENQARAVSTYNGLDMGLARRLLWAAEACEGAFDDEQAAKTA